MLMHAPNKPAPEVLTEETPKQETAVDSSSGAKKKYEPLDSHSHMLLWGPEDNAEVADFTSGLQLP